MYYTSKHTLYNVKHTKYPMYDEFKDKLSRMHYCHLIEIVIDKAWTSGDSRDGVDSPVGREDEGEKLLKQAIDLPLTLRSKTTLNRIVCY